MDKKLQKAIDTLKNPGPGTKVSHGFVTPINTESLTKEACDIVRDLAASFPIITIDSVVDYECGFCHVTTDARDLTYLENGRDPNIKPEKYPHKPWCLWVRASEWVKKNP